MFRNDKKNNNNRDRHYVTIKSRLSEVYKTPVGHDLLCKIGIYSGKGSDWIKNPFVGFLRLSVVLSVLKGISSDFLDVCCKLLNNTTAAAQVMVHGMPDKVGEISQEEPEEWWREAVFYQIYPRSFYDSDGDGLGDLNGIIEKLDYIESIGVDCIWLCPIYDSPNADNGYDVRDYEMIMAEFGNMEIFEKLLEEIHKRKMRLIVDLVVNHTSDEHEWFRKALEDPDGEFGKFYFLRKGTDEKTPPNNWESCFGGSAWNYYKEQGVWALHVFSKKQMDLNWDNPKLRMKIEDMINRWLDKGVDGFRLDAVNLISKEDGLPDGNVDLGNFIGYRGAEKYFYGPHLHEYLHEVCKECFEKYNAFSVGETPGLGLEMSKLLTNPLRRELNMVFNFDHLESDGHLRFDTYKYDLNWYKSYIKDWTENYSGSVRPALYFENHDNPRMVSKICDDEHYRVILCKLLALLLLTERGTPFIYQGEEIGMVNKKFKGMSDIEDVESLGLFEKKLSEGMKAEEAFKHILAGTRDHARSPMQWTKEPYGGFTTGKPWFIGDNDYEVCNVEDSQADPNSVLNFYREVIKLRRSDRDLTYGKMVIMNAHIPNYFAYTRGKYFIECNLVDRNIIRPEQKVERKKRVRLERILGSYGDMNMVQGLLRPYEANLYRIVSEE